MSPFSFKPPDTQDHRAVFVQFPGQKIAMCGFCAVFHDRNENDTNNIKQKWHSGVQFLCSFFSKIGKKIAMCGFCAVFLGQNQKQRGLNQTETA